MSDGWFFRYIKSKNTKSMRYKRELADKICGHSMKYVTVASGDRGDVVIGKDCTCRVADGYFTVTDGNGDLIYKVSMDNVKLFELMSLDGVVITFPDPTADEGERTVVAYYSYYRKLDD